MFNDIAANHDQLLRLILSNMENHGYDLPYPPDVAHQVRYVCEDDMTYPALVSFSNTVDGSGRVVYVKFCGKSIAKTLLYTKTSKSKALSRDLRGRHSWVRCNGIDKYRHLVVNMCAYMKYSYKIKHTIYPSDRLIAQCMDRDKPFLVSRSTFADADKRNRLSSKVFIVEHHRAKALVYYNKNRPAPSSTKFRSAANPGTNMHKRALRQPTTAVHTHNDSLTWTALNGEKYVIEENRSF